MPRSIATAEQSARPAPSVPPPSGTRRRDELPGELVDAIAVALECEAGETNVHVRAELLARVRDVTEQWLAGAFTLEGALDALSASHEGKSGIALRRPR
jgi:hypothetical protein